MVEGQENPQQQEPSPRDLLWRELALCYKSYDARFFPDTIKAGPSSENYLKAAAVCVRCPVRRQCLEYALQTRQEFGVWGGFSPKERKRILKKRKRKQKQ